MIEKRKLTPKQKRFVDEYLIDLNATAAAIRAGYKEKRAYATGFENLKKPEIQIAIEDKQALRARRTEITQDRIILEMARLGLSDIRKVFNEDGSLKAVKDFDNDTAPAVSSIKVTADMTEIKFWDKNSALEKLMKHLSLNPDDRDNKINELVSALNRICERHNDR